MLSYNCIICAEEFSKEDLSSDIARDLNKKKYKICQQCLEKCDPEEDFRQVKEIVQAYIKFAYDIEVEEDIDL